MEILTLAQLADRIDVSEHLDLYLDKLIMWAEPSGRIHLEPIDDEV